VSLDAPPRPSAVSRLGTAAAFRVAGAVIGLGMFASGVLSPLYDVYQAHWDFSTFTLTLVFAVYCCGVLASLLLLGRLSDEIGRRPVLIAALGGLIASTLLFLVAQSVAWLLVARLLQGAATGAALAAAAAALIDFHPDGDDEHAGFVNGLVSGIGMACGVLTSSLLVELAPAPRVLPFALLLVLLIALLAAVCLLPESVERTAHPRLRPARPHVPRSARSAFVLASLGVLASWSVLGVLLALGPKLVHELVDGGGHLAGGTVMFTTVVAATIASIWVRHAEVRRATIGGSLGLALGMALMAASLSTGSLAALLAAGAVAGAGFGVAFLGALRALTRVVPEHHRAETMAAFYLVAYGSNALPALAAGVVLAHAALLPTFRAFALAVGCVALAAAWAAWRAPAPPPPRTRPAR
jgi:MFS family permease